MRTLKELGRSYLTITQDLDASDESDQSAVSQLGHSLQRHHRVCGAASQRVVGQDFRNLEFACGPNGSTSNSICCEPCARKRDAICVVESHRHPAVKLLRQIPSIGPIRAALLVASAANATPFPYQATAVGVQRFRSRNSRQRRVPLRRVARCVAIGSASACEGLSDNHNHDLKNLFKGTAISASTRPGPLRDFYLALLAKGMRPTMARLTLATEDSCHYFNHLEEREWTSTPNN